MNAAEFEEDILRDKRSKPITKKKQTYWDKQLNPAL